MSKKIKTLDFFLLVLILLFLVFYAAPREYTEFLNKFLGADDFTVARGTKLCADGDPGRYFLLLAEQYQEFADDKLEAEGVFLIKDDMIVFKSSQRSQRIYFISLWNEKKEVIGMSVGDFEYLQEECPENKKNDNETDNLANATAAQAAQDSIESGAENKKESSEQPSVEPDVDGQVTLDEAQP